MTRKWILLALLLTGSEAQAQDSTTVCNSIGDTRVCNSSVRQPREHWTTTFNRDVQALRDSIEARKQREQAEKDHAAFMAHMAEQDRLYAQQQQEIERQIAALEAQEQARRNWLAAVSVAIRVGDCQTAKDIALRAGDLDIAEQAMRLCTPARKAP